MYLIIRHSMGSKVGGGKYIDFLIFQTWCHMVWLREIKQAMGGI